MKKINLIAACIAAVLSVLCTGCPNDTAGETEATATTTTIAYHKLDPLSVSDIGSSLDNLSDDVKGVELTVSEAAPDLSQLGNIIRNHGDISFKLDLSQCSDMASIKDKEFYGCGNLISISIPDSVTSIDSSAFYKCSALQSITVNDGNSEYSSKDGILFSKNGETLIIYPYGKEGILYTIPDGVTSIGDSAFLECSGLTNVTIPDGVTSIGDLAFYGCSGLTNVTIPDSVTSIGDGAFYNCDKLTSVTIGSGVISIGDGAFYGCSGLTNVTILDSVTNIGGRAFYNCDKLTSVTIGSGVTSIGDSAFYGCSGLATLSVKAATPPAVGSNAFDSSVLIIVPADSVSAYKSASGWKGYSKICSEQNIQDGFVIEGTTLIGLYDNTISNAVIPAGVTSIGEEAFYHCSGLTSVTIPDSVASIGDRAFDGCSSLANVTIGRGATSIGDRAFRGCYALTVKIDATDPPSIEEWYTFESSVPIIVPAGSVSTYKSADGWKSYSRIYSEQNIQDSKFVIEGTTLIGLYDKTISSAVIPAGITSIGEGAFGWCSSLTSVTIPSSVTSIGVGAFAKCSSLTSITIPDSVTSIGYNAFVECFSLTNVTIGSGVTSIEYYTFYICSNLTNVTIGNSVTSIGEVAFGLCSSLTSITIPDSVRSIGGGAFGRCESLASITIPDSVTEIGNGAFNECSELTAINVGTGNTAYCSVDGVLFNKNKTKLIKCPGGKKGTFTIPSSVTSIVDYAFDGCSGLTSVTIPSSVTSIVAGAFSGCSGLTSVTIPDSVTSIDYGAFSGCIGLTSVTISDSVTSIGDSSFSNCAIESLTHPCLRIENGVAIDSDNCVIYLANVKNTDLVIPDSVTSIGDKAFSGCSGLTSVTISDSVTSIGRRAFSGCSGLTNVTIGRGVTSIGDEAFYECSGPITLTVKAINPPALGQKVLYYFDWSTDSFTLIVTAIYVPSSSVEAYMSASGWKDRSSIIMGKTF